MSERTVDQVTNAVVNVNAAPILPCVIANGCQSSGFGTRILTQPQPSSNHAVLFISSMAPPFSVVEP